jgi:dTMP kinase
MEREAGRFHERVRHSYRRLAAAEPDRFVVVDATRPVNEVAAEALDVVLRRLPRSTRGADER